MIRAARWVAGGFALAALNAAAAPNARPHAGHHAAELCVATSDSPASCGPAQADVGRGQSLSVRVDDVLYKLQLRSSQAEVVVMHNHVLIDEFIAPYEWVGATLQFDDIERHSRYEVRFAVKAAKR